MITLAGDGGFHYAPPHDASGLTSDSFVYEIANATGAATARVTLVIGCGMGSCNGCCTADGQCDSGSSDESCGGGGEACRACTDVSKTCSAVKPAATRS